MLCLSTVIVLYYTITCIFSMHVETCSVTLASELLASTKSFTFANILHA